jgi:2-amino-4-hydroxy-6-hydroxymethyldihydropteridine diphosphokinase
MVEAYIALGSNVGDREANIKKAFDALKERIKIVKSSSLYETKPMYIEDQGWFLNCTAKVETDLAPEELLKFLKSIEQKLGRKTLLRNGPRIIDLDIIFYGGQILKENDLQVPHPKIGERPFVLVPLAEIAPNFIHPVNKKTIVDILSELDYDKSEIRLKSKQMISQMETRHESLR